MKTNYIKANKTQVINNIALAIYDKPEKIKQLIKVQSITIEMTSDDHIGVTCEMYANNIVRYLIKGTRSNTTVTINTLTNEVTRKPYKVSPLYISDISHNLWCFEILEKIAELKNVPYETLFN